MFETILIIRRTEGFIINNIKKNLSQKQYTVTECGIDEEEIRAVKDDASVIIFYVTEDLEAFSKPMIYIKELCVEENKQLILISNPMEYEVVSKYISEELIADVIGRPVDIERLLSDIEEILDEQSMQARKKCILIVDDDPTYLRTIRGWLKDHYRVGMANSGMQALTWLAGNEADLILLDYDMPVTSGPQVLRMLKAEANSAGVPVMFLTGKSDKLSVLRGVSLKPEGYLLKTIGKNALLETIDNYFTEHAKGEDDSDDAVSTEDSGDDIWSEYGVENNGLIGGGTGDEN